MVQYYCDGRPPRLWHLANVQYTVAQLVSTSSGLCLSPAGGTSDINNALVIYGCDSNPARTWAVFHD